MNPYDFNKKLHTKQAELKAYATTFGQGEPVK
jgi:hypothetical protein